MDPRQHAPATARNRRPILEVLRRVLPAEAEVLEIASGSGEHAAHFAAAMPRTRWQPSDGDPRALASIDAWGAQAGVANVRPALALDVTAISWPVGAFDAVFNANMIHIAPWEAALGLLAGAARHLRADGLVVIYGPFLIDTAHTAASNAAFDADLRRRDPRWGVRDLDVLLAAGAEAGLGLVERVEMPANNQLLVLRAGALTESVADA